MSQIYHEDVRLHELKDLYIYLLKYGCHVTDFKEMDGSYLVGLGSKYSTTAKWIILSPVAEEE